MNGDNYHKKYHMEDSKYPTNLTHQINLEIHAYKRLHRKYCKDISEQYNQKVLEELVFNKKTHMVAQFKEYMIADYIDEFLKREYKMRETIERLPKFANYYQNYLKFFGIPTLCDLEVNEIVKEYGEKRAEAYYNKNYQIIDDESNSYMMEMDDNLTQTSVDKTIFNSKIKDTINNVTMFTNKNTESNVVTITNTKRKKTSSNDYVNESSITLSENENDNLVSNEASLISYVKMFSHHHMNKMTKSNLNSRIQVKRLCPYPPPNALTKRRKDKDELGSNSENSHNLLNNQSISKLKGLISASNIYLSNKKHQLNKSPLQNHKKSNLSNGSNASTQNMRGNFSKDCICSKYKSKSKSKSRNIENNLYGFKTDELTKHHNDLKFQLTKTQKIDNIISKYTISQHSKKILSSNTKKNNDLTSQLRINLKHHPLIAGQLKQKSSVKSNPNILKTKNNFNAPTLTEKNIHHHPKQPQYSQQTHQNHKQSADDLMKMALTLFMEKNAKSNANVNININNQININTNYQAPVQSPVSIHNHHETIQTKLMKNDSVTSNINANLTSLLKSRNYSRNKSNNNLGGNTEDDRTLGTSSCKGKIFTSWCPIEKKATIINHKMSNIKLTNLNATPNNYIRPTSNDLSLKQRSQQHNSQYQHNPVQPQIKSYLSKESSTKTRNKPSFASSNRLFQTMKPSLMSTNHHAKSISSFKSQK